MISIDRNKFIKDENSKYFMEFICCVSKLNVNEVKFQSGNNNIIFQTEQLSNDFVLSRLLESSSKIILEYSVENKSILVNININQKVILCPLFFIREFVFESKPKEYDFVIIGHFSSRRKYIYEDLNQRGYKILNITNEYDMERKYDLILRAKCLINIHAYDDNKLFEFARCAVPVYNNMNVISEESIIKKEKENLSNAYILEHILFCKYEEIIDVSIKNLERKINIDYSYLEKISKYEIQRINRELK